MAVAQSPDSGSGGESGTESGPDGPGLVSDGGTQSPPDAGPDPVAHARYHGVAHVGAERYGRDLTRISQEVLQHLAALEGVDLDITIEISAHKADGFPEDKVRVILENARALKFDHSTFESD